jgi:lysosomal Pro-X carboxypeptidase
MAMTDYPEKSDFLQPMPAWPVTAACANARSDPAPGPYAAVLAAIDVYYNSSGQTGCYNLTGGGTGAAGWLGDSGWDYLACTSQIMYALCFFLFALALFFMFYFADKC